MHRFVCLAAVAALSSSASAAFFSFETEAATNLPDGTRVGAHTELILSNDGVDLKITRVGGGAFDIFDNDTFAGFGPEFRPPAAWATRSLDPFWDGEGIDGIGFIFEFSVPIDIFAFDFGDFGGDEDDVEAFAYSDLARTDLVDSNSGFLQGNTTTEFVSDSMGLTGTIRSVVITGGSEDFPHSVFIDNIFANPIPAPSTAALLALTVVGGARRRR